VGRRTYFERDLQAGGGFTPMSFFSNVPGQRRSRPFFIFLPPPSFPLGARHVITTYNFRLSFFIIPRRLCSCPFASVSPGELFFPDPRDFASFSCRLFSRSRPIPAQTVGPPLSPPRRTLTRPAEELFLFLSFASPIS